MPLPMLTRMMTLAYSFFIVYLVDLVGQRIISFASYRVSLRISLCAEGIASVFLYYEKTLNVVAKSRCTEGIKTHWGCLWDAYGLIMKFAVGCVANSTLVSVLNYSDYFLAKFFSFFIRLKRIKCVSEYIKS